ncbi:MAG: anti-sigma F factor [Clostridiales bacterium]|nr:anti-sigma F factor [Clostridiales bacterium]
MENYMKLELLAVSENESFARSAVAAFALSLNPTLTELSDIKTAVSEAVTNCIVHAYANGGENNRIIINCKIEKAPVYSPFSEMEGERRGILHIEITDFGCGIDNVEQALTPFYTTLAGEERSGMGFTIMQTFMDGFSVESKKDAGTVVRMLRKIGAWDKEEQNADVRERVDA